MNNEFISQLHNYAKAIRILAKVYLPVLLVTPLKLQDILASVKETLTKTNPDYDIVIKRLHLYYNMKLITFSIDQKTGPVPVIDKNTKADPYTQLQIIKPYIALNTKTYIKIRQQELVTCKKIGHEFYREEHFVVRHKSRYSCKSAIYFDLDNEIIKQNCDCKFYYSKTDVTLTVLLGGNKIILANWPYVNT